MAARSSQQDHALGSGEAPRADAGSACEAREALLPEGGGPGGDLEGSLEVQEAQLRKDDGEAPFDRIRHVLNGVLSFIFRGGFLALVAVYAFIASAFFTSFWFPPPSSGGGGKTCGNTTGSLSHPPWLLLAVNDTWVLNGFRKEDLQAAGIHNWSYSGACYDIHVADVVEEPARAPCAEWCDRHLGNFSFNLGCFLRPVVHVCFKAKVADYFMGVSPFVRYGAVVAYASTSALLGFRRWRSFKRGNPGWLQSRRFQGHDKPARLFFVLPVTEALKQWLLLRKLFFTIAGDVLTDLLNIFNLLQSGEPFFAVGLLVFMMAMVGEDDVCQSGAFSAWALSLDVGFPTRDLLEKSNCEGWESLASGLISMYVLLMSPRMSLTRLCTFSVSAGFSLLSLRTGLESRKTLDVMEEHPDTEWDFDRRLELTRDVSKDATASCAVYYHAFVVVIAAVVTSKYNTVLVAERLGIIFGLPSLAACFVALVLCVAGAELWASGGHIPTAVGNARRKWRTAGRKRATIWGESFIGVSFVPWVIVHTVKNPDPARSLEFFPCLSCMGGLDEWALALVKAAILWTGAVAWLGCLYRITQLPQVFRESSPEQE